MNSVVKKREIFNYLYHHLKNIMKVYTSVLALLILFGNHVFAQNKIETIVEQLISAEEYKNATVGLQFVDLESGKTIYETNSNKPIIPASVLKIITTASAIEILGPNYRFETKIGYSGKIEDEILAGNLILIGGGDPTLGSEYFKDRSETYNFIEAWVQQIKAAGIKRIHGDIILDGSAFDTEKVPPTWIWEDIGNYYGAGANAFSVYDNLFRIIFKSSKRAGELTEIISTYPKIEGLEIKNEVVSSNINRDLAYVFGSPVDKTRVIRGTIPKGRSSFTIKAAIHNPEEVLAYELLSNLAKNGIFISGKVKFEEVNKKNFRTIYTHYSPELIEIARVINHKSVNLFAEHLVRQMAYEKTGLGSRDTGLEIIREFWVNKGMNTESLCMEDGSGLSHFNAVSPSQFNFILSFMQKHSALGLVFLQTLPVAGQGTLASFNPKLFPENTLKAKSGSMTRVRCYSGYLITDLKKKIAFTIMFNQFSGSGAKLSKEIENLLVEVKHNY